MGAGLKQTRLLYYSGPGLFLLEIRRIHGAGEDSTRVGAKNQTKEQVPGALKKAPIEQGPYHPCLEGSSCLVRPKK